MITTSKSHLKRKMDDLQSSSILEIILIVYNSLLLDAPPSSQPPVPPRTVPTTEGTTGHPHGYPPFLGCSPSRDCTKDSSTHDVSNNPIPTHGHPTSSIDITKQVPTPTTPTPSSSRPPVHQYRGLMHHCFRLHKQHQHHHVITTIQHSTHNLNIQWLNGSEAISLTHATTL